MKELVPFQDQRGFPTFLPSEGVSDDPPDGLHSGASSTMTAGRASLTADAKLVREPHPQDRTGAPFLGEFDSHGNRAG